MFEVKEIEPNFWVYPEWINNAFTRVDFMVKDDVTNEIDSYGELKEGWNYGKGIQSNEQTILNAKFVYLIANFQEFGAEPHPNTDGSITMILFYGDHFLDVDIKDEKLTLRYEVGKGKDYKVVWKNKEILLADLEFVLFEIKSKCKTTISSGILISKRTIANKSKDFNIELSSKNSMEAYQYFPKDAHSQLANTEFVPI